MLLRNILAMFVPWKEIYWTFITNNNLVQHQEAIQSPHYKFFTGHLDHTPETSILMRDFTLILNIRDPYGYVLSNARSFYSQPKYKDSVLARYIQDHSVSFDDVVPLMINGVCFHGEVVPNVAEVYVNKAMNWFRSAGKVVSHEELCRHIQNLSTSEAKTYFQDILDLLQIDRPRDWRQRVSSGSAPEISTTFSGNLGPDVDRRNHLLESEKALFSLVAPHLREILGYEQQQDC